MTEESLERALKTGRVDKFGNALRHLRFQDESSAVAIGNLWEGYLGQSDPVYVVQTNVEIVRRCILMSTDPGDLVLDPTCGSGTTATVAEQWGRRWITIDTSRVALALARARIMGARYPYYLLADSPEGQAKEAEVTRTVPSSHSTSGDLRHGFVYERVPHITLKSIANNTEVDVIWDNWQEKMEPLRAQLNEELGKQWQEWEIPRDATDTWPETAIKLHVDWWKAKLARQQEIDKSIAAKAEFEFLYDKPYTDNKKVRVAGPFTVESLSPHRVLGVDENDELIDRVKAQGSQYEPKQTFAQMILENLKTSGVQQAHKEDKIEFVSLVPWPGELIYAEGTYEETEAGTTADESRPFKYETSVLTPKTEHPTPSARRAAIMIGPEFGTVTRPDLVLAAREAGDSGFDMLIACAFNYEAHTTEFNKLGRIPVLKARMNADLHMSDNLKNTGKGNLFVIFGEPDISVTSGQWLVAGNGRLVANYEHVKELLGVGSLAEINSIGRTGLSGIDKTIAAIQTLRDDDFPIAVTTNHMSQITVHGVDVFHPSTGQVQSDGPDSIACWFIDTDYNEESFFVRHAYFLGANNPYTALKTTLKAEINQEAWETLHSDISRPFEKPTSGRIAVKVINHLGDEVMKVFRVN